MQRHIIPARSAGNENQFAITNDRTGDEFLFEYSGDKLKIAGKYGLTGWVHVDPEFVPDDVKEAAEEFSRKEIIPIHR